MHLLIVYLPIRVFRPKSQTYENKSPTLVHELSETLKLKLILPASVTVPSSLRPIDELHQKKSDYEFESLAHLLPSDSIQKHRFMDMLISDGLSYPCMALIHSPGSNIGNSVFAWRVPESFDSSMCFEKSQPVIEEIKKVLPVYHARAMRTTMFEKFGRVSSNVKPAILRYFYKNLTGQSGDKFSVQLMFINFCYNYR